MRIRAVRSADEEVLFEPIPDYAPSAVELESLVGQSYSPDAETTLTAVAEAGKLVLLRRPKTRIELVPIYADGFEGPSLGLIRFIRDDGGRVTQLSVRQDRVYDPRFRRILK